MTKIDNVKRLRSPGRVMAEAAQDSIWSLEWEAASKFISVTWDNAYWWTYEAVMPRVACGPLGQIHLMGVRGRI